MLVGPPKIEGEWGTGLIPGSDLVEWARRQGVPDSLDGVVVRHASGGVSTLGFKSYDQGRTRWQAETLTLRQKLYFLSREPIQCFRVF
jgi:hypothetical protein